LRGRRVSASLLPVDERDVQTLMETLFEMNANIKRILDILEDENGEEEEEADS
jgi:hypothetical protein